MVNIYKEADAKIAEAFRRGKENLVTFNRLFLPIEDEVEPAWFHYLWSDILLMGINTLPLKVSVNQQRARTYYVRFLCID